MPIQIFDYSTSSPFAICGRRNQFSSDGNEHGHDGVNIIDREAYASPNGRRVFAQRVNLENESIDA
jgi:hypothetical protein